MNKGHHLKFVFFHVIWLLKKNVLKNVNWLKFIHSISVNFAQGPLFRA